MGEVEKGDVVDFSGTYCFASVAQSVRSFGKELADIPFLELVRVPEGAQIEIEHLAGRSIRFRFQGVDGQPVVSELNLAKAKMHWDSGRLVVLPSPVAAGARLGIGSGKQESSIFRMKDGRLILHDLSSEAGMAFLVIPFRERYEIVVELLPKPADRGCR